MLAGAFVDDQQWILNTPSRGARRGATVVLPLVPDTVMAAPTVIAVPAGGGRDIPFDTGWLFQLGEGSGLEGPTLDDKGWKAVDLPHDWSVEDVPGKGTPFDKNAVGAGPTGYTIGGEGWYRKHFRLDDIAPDARVEIVFEGVYELSDVWLNGTRVGASVAG